MGTPFEMVAAGRPTENAAKRHLVALSRSIEARAASGADRAALYVCLQRRSFFTTRTEAIYRGLVERGAQVHLYGVGMTPADLPGAVCHHLDWDDPLAREWNVLLLDADGGWGLVARESGQATADLDRPFDWTTTTDRGQLALAAQGLIGRLAA